MTEYPEDHPTLSAGPPPVMYSDHVYDYPSSEHHDSSHLSWPIIVAVIGACVAVIAVVIAATVVLTSPTRTSSEPATVISIATPVAPSTVTSVSTVTSTTSSPSGFAYQPLWPFAAQQEADRWLREDAPHGISRWHADPEATALNFTQNYLGFSEIDRVTHVDDQGEEAWVSVGYTLPNGEETTAATIHLVRYGTGPNAAWEVVGTEDTTLTVTAPPYGSSVGPVVYAGGAITGVDEAVHVQLRQSTQQTVLGEFCCVQTGGNPGSWSAQVHVNGAQPCPLTMVVWTGGHVARVERFAITGLHAE